MRAPVVGGRAISTVLGCAEHVLLSFGEEAATRPGYRRMYRHLFAELRGRARLTIVCESRARPALDELLAESGAPLTHVIDAPSDLQLTVWAQDASVVLGGDDVDATPILLRPRAFDRADDDRVPELLEAHGVVRTVRTDLSFVGAQILVGDDVAVVARDCIVATEGDDVVERFRAALGVDRVVVVGTDAPVPSETVRPCAHEPNRVEVVDRGAGLAVPLSHLDMFVTLAGHDRVLVGSPALAAELLGQPTFDHARQTLYDDVADGLGSAGFDVIRNPLPLTYGDGRRMVDGVSRDVRLWYHASANNCLVQVDPIGGHHVWLPTYGHAGWTELAVTDAANRAIWEGLGFTVHELPSCHVLAQRLGVVRCLTKDLVRTPPRSWCR